MSPSPTMSPLSRKHRQWLFIVSIIVFASAVPLLVFYAIGYRIDLSGETSNIRTVGGIYASTDTANVKIYIDDEPVKNMRIFQNAAYIQDLDAGLHQIHTQGEMFQTWVKELPVYAQYVTEVSSFNLPITPQIRLVTKFTTDSKASVVGLDATSSLAFASTTNSFYATSSTATSSFNINPEYTYLAELFASSTAERQLFKQQQNQDKRFVFQPTATTSEILVATTTKVRDDIILQEIDDDIEAVWVGSNKNRPAYFCVTYTGPKSTILAYGTHVYEDIVDEFGEATDLFSDEIIGAQMCRDSVRIDSQGKEVKYFNFLPKRSDLVIMHLPDGIYVTEIDDRAWQNVQLLYPGDDLDILIESNSIFVKDGGIIMEVFTEIRS